MIFYFQISLSLIGLNLSLLLVLSSIFANGLEKKHFSWHFANSLEKNYKKCSGSIVGYLVLAGTFVRSAWKNGSFSFARDKSHSLADTVNQKLPVQPVVPGSQVELPINWYRYPPMPMREIQSIMPNNNYLAWSTCYRNSYIALTDEINSLKPQEKEFLKYMDLRLSKKLHSLERDLRESVADDINDNYLDVNRLPHGCRLEPHSQILSAIRRAQKTQFKDTEYNNELINKTLKRIFKLANIYSLQLSPEAKNRLTLYVINHIHTVNELTRIYTNKLTYLYSYIAERDEIDDTRDFVENATEKVNPQIQQPCIATMRLAAKFEHMAQQRIAPVSEQQTIVPVPNTSRVPTVFKQTDVSSTKGKGKAIVEHTDVSSPSSKSSSSPKSDAIVEETPHFMTNVYSSNSKAIVVSSSNSTANVQHTDVSSPGWQKPDIFDIDVDIFK